MIRLRKHAWLALAMGLVAFGTEPATSQGYGGDAPKADAGSDAKEEKKSRSWGRKKEEQKKGGWARQDVMDERTSKRMAEALEHLHAERYDECAEVLGKLRMKSLNGFERSQVLRTYAFIHIGKGEMVRALEYLQKTLDEQALPPEDLAGIQFQIAQLYLSQERWDDVVKSLETWFTMVEKPNSAAYYLLSIAHYQLKDIDAALVPAQKAVDLSDEPLEGWLQLLLALRLTRQEYAVSVPLLERLVKNYPKKVYWIQLSTVHGALGNYEEALIPLQLAYSQDLLTTDSEQRRLAEMLLFLDLPYRSAQVMSHGLESEVIKADQHAYEVLSNSHIAARDYDESVAPLERAAELADDGDLFIRLAQVHLQREKWSDAEAALHRAIKKGHLGNPGEAHVLMGIALYSQQKPVDARTWFGRALGHSATKKEAGNWIEHIDRELSVEPTA
jgi:tetratricopeptide (TPR) repeat protein